MKTKVHGGTRYYEIRPPLRRRFHLGWPSGKAGPHHHWRIDCARMDRHGHLAVRGLHRRQASTPSYRIAISDIGNAMNVMMAFVDIAKWSALIYVVFLSGARIANRSVTMDVVYYGHDNNCHPQHEIIAAKPDMVAERYE